MRGINLKSHLKDIKDRHEAGKEALRLLNKYQYKSTRGE